MTEARVVKAKLGGFHLDYSSGGDPVADLVEYVGNKKARILRELAAKAETTYEQFAFCCGLAGVQGKPVAEAWTLWRGD